MYQSHRLPFSIGLLSLLLVQNLVNAQCPVGQFKSGSTCSNCSATFYQPVPNNNLNQQQSCIACPTNSDCATTSSTGNPTFNCLPGYRNTGTSCVYVGVTSTTTSTSLTSTSRRSTSLTSTSVTSTSVSSTSATPTSTTLITSTTFRTTSATLSTSTTPVSSTTNTVLTSTTRTSSTPISTTSTLVTSTRLTSTSVTSTSQSIRTTLSTSTSSTLVTSTTRSSTFQTTSTTLSSSRTSTSLSTTTRPTTIASLSSSSRTPSSTSNSITRSVSSTSLFSSSSTLFSTGSTVSANFTALGAGASPTSSSFQLSISPVSADSFTPGADNPTDQRETGNVTTDTLSFMNMIVIAALVVGLCLIAMMILFFGRGKCRRSSKLDDSKTDAAPTIAIETTMMQAEHTVANVSPPTKYVMPQGSDERKRSVSVIAPPSEFVVPTVYNSPLQQFTQKSTDDEFLDFNVPKTPVINHVFDLPVPEEAPGEILDETPTPVEVPEVVPQPGAQNLDDLLNGLDNV